MSDDDKRLAEIRERLGIPGAMFAAADVSALLRLLTERTAELERVREAHETTCRNFHSALAALSDANARAEQAESSLAAALKRVETLEIALRRIDAINDSPARFNSDIDKTILAALSPQEGA